MIIIWPHKISMASFESQKQNQKQLIKHMGHIRSPIWPLLCIQGPHQKCNWIRFTSTVFARVHSKVAVLCHLQPNPMANTQKIRRSWSIMEGVMELHNGKNKWSWLIVWKFQPSSSEACHSGWRKYTMASRQEVVTRWKFVPDWSQQQNALSELLKYMVTNEAGITNYCRNTVGANPIRGWGRSGITLQKIKLLLMSQGTVGGKL